MRIRRWAAGRGHRFRAVPSAITRPGQSRGDSPLQEEISAPPNLPLARVPLFGPLSIPGDREDEGPPDGLSLDAAIERLIRENLALRAARSNSPKCRRTFSPPGSAADPLVYADSQLNPLWELFRETPRRPGAV